MGVTRESWSAAEDKLLKSLYLSGQKPLQIFDSRAFAGRTYKSISSRIHALFTKKVGAVLPDDVPAAPCEDGCPHFQACAYNHLACSEFGVYLGATKQASSKRVPSRRLYDAYFKVRGSIAEGGPPPNAYPNELQFRDPTDQILDYLGHPSLWEDEHEDLSTIEALQEDLE